MATDDLTAKMIASDVPEMSELAHNHPDIAVILYAILHPEEFDPMHLGRVMGRLKGPMGEVAGELRVRVRQPMISHVE